MANYLTGADLVDDVLFRSGEPTDGTSDFNAVALTYVNRAYQIIWMGGAELDPSVNEEWWWLRKDPPGKLTLQPRIACGTVSVTNNLMSINFSAAPSPKIDASLASGWFFKVDDNPDVFRISTHTSGATAATLDSRYTGQTATAKSYIVFKLEYPLATDVLRIVSPMRVYQESKDEIEGVPLMSLERDYPLRLIQGGVPLAFAHVQERKVRFSRYGTTGLIRSEYDYMRQPAALTDATGSIPLVPQHYRKTLADAGLFFLLMDKNDNRADAVGLMARSGIKAMARENRQRTAGFSRRMGQIIPRGGQQAKDMAPLRTESGLILG